MTYPELVGKQFGFLTVVSGSSKKPYCVTVRCVCGTEKPIAARDLTRVRIDAKRKTATVHSCGCMASKTKAEKRRTHGGAGTPEHESWTSMLSRCFNPAVESFPNYGGRGITVCQRWRNSFAAFLKDMGPRPTGTSLDRYPNNDGNYEPGNCRWATMREQASNTRRNRFYELSGERLTIQQVATKVGMSYWTLRSRLDRGVSIEQAVR
jgi:hypothetical protein